MIPERWSCTIRYTRVQYNIDVVKRTLKLQVPELQFSVRFYDDANGNKPASRLPRGICENGTAFCTNSSLPGSKSSRRVEQHRTAADCDWSISRRSLFELRIGGKNIARDLLLFSGKAEELILTHGYVKKQQKVDARELGGLGTV